MISSYAMLIVMTLSQVFDVTALPLEDQKAHCFVADWDGDRNGDFFVLDGHTLSILHTGVTPYVEKLSLDSGVTVFDVVDIEGDGPSEIIAIAGDRVLRYAHPPMSPADTAEQSPPETLFQLTTHFSGNTQRPTPYVLAEKRDSEVVLRLPTEDGLEIRSLEGTRLELIAAQLHDPTRIGYTESFSANSVGARTAGHPESLEFRIRRMIAPDNVSSEDVVEFPNRRGTRRQAREAEHLGPEAWPWFAIRPDAPNAARALYALTGPRYFETRIRMRMPETGDAAAPDAVRVGPPRRYPGALIVDTPTLPDFNGDGFVDLLLWKAPRPVPTVDALTKALTQGDWPIRITIHLFSEAKGRFPAQPADYLQLQVPFEQLLLGNTGDVPVPLLVVEDFDGDGRTDFGCATAPDTFAVWLFGEEGFAENPNFQHVFPEPINAIVMRKALSGAGKTSLALRGDHTLYFLQAAK